MDRLLVHRAGDQVRLITRNGYDYAKRFPWIVQAALSNQHKQFVVDGEAVVLISTHCIPASKMPRSCSRSMERTCASFPWQSARSSLRSCSKAGRTDLYKQFRARRDRSRSVSPGMPYGFGRAGFETSRRPLSRRPGEGLDQGENRSHPAMQRVNAFA
jgi:hypothetical protein